MDKERMMKLVKSILFSASVLLLAAGCTATDTGLSAPSAGEAAPAVKSYDKPGFVTAVIKGRLWVFAEGSKELAAFRETGKTPAVHVVRPLAGPDRMTLLSPDAAVLDGYMK